VLLRDGKIAAFGTALEIPDGTRIIDCSGRAITAGFWNGHVHFHERKWADVDSIPERELDSQLRELTRYGFTSVFDLSSAWKNTRRLRDRIESGAIRGPRIRSTGEGILPIGGTPSAEVFRALGLTDTALFEVDYTAQARDAAAKLLDGGVDGLKLFISASSAARLSPEIIRAVTEEAHRAGKPVFAHPNSEADIFAALDGGVDIIAHTTPRSGAWTPEVLRRMKAAGATLIPTLAVWQFMMRHDRMSVRDALVETAVAQLRAWLDAGGGVLFGTDLAAIDYDPSEEYALMARAGATFPQILASLTTIPAQRFGGATRLGEIAIGNSADLVVLAGSPSADISALTSVRYAVRNGEIIYDRAATF
jgi:imidazolonepropionase-like amidohydrolase